MESGINLKNKPSTNGFWLVPGMIAILLLACAQVQRDESPSVNFNRVTFLSGWSQSGTVQLTNGRYEEATAPGSASKIVVELSDNIAYGKLNGKDAAAAVLVTNSGGSGTFYDLALLIKDKQRWVNKDIASLGDRVTVHAVVIKENRILVDLTAHGPEDPMCCPTRRMEYVFAVQVDTGTMKLFK